MFRGGFRKLALADRRRRLAATATTAGGHVFLREHLGLKRRRRDQRDMVFDELLNGRAGSDKQGDRYHDDVDHDSGYASLTLIAFGLAPKLFDCDGLGTDFEGRKLGGIEEVLDVANGGLKVRFLHQEQAAEVLVALRLDWGNRREFFQFLIHMPQLAFYRAQLPC